MCVHFNWEPGISLMKLDMNIFNYSTTSKRGIKLNCHEMPLNCILIRLKDIVYNVRLLMLPHYVCTAFCIAEGIQTVTFDF